MTGEALQFESMDEVKKALRCCVMDATDSDEGELDRVTELTRLAGSYARAWASGTETLSDQDRNSLEFLTRELVAAVKKLHAWHDGIHRLSVIIAGDDLKAADKYPGLNRKKPNYQ